MSRTDKDNPWWVTTEWWQTRHNHCDRAHESPHHGYRLAGTPVTRTCDLPPDPVISTYHAPETGCHWTPEHTNRRWSLDEHPPRWLVDAVWNNRQRLRVRDTCRAATKEYRGSGDVWTEPPVDQHHHCATW